MRKTSSESFELLFQKSTDLLCLFTAEGHYKKTNPAWEKTFGYSSNELSGKQLISHIHPQDLKKAGHAINQLIYNRREQDLLCRFLCKDGSYKQLEGRLFFLDDILCLSARDVTKTKNTEQEIKENEARLRKAQTIGNIGYAEQLAGTREIWASAEAMKIYGFSTEEGYITQDQFIACLCDFEDFRKSFMDLLEKGEKFDKEFAINPVDGSPQKYVREVIDVERDENGKPQRFLTIVLDVTDRRKVEEALRKRVLALTKPMDDSEGLKFTDLFNIQDLQQLQDTFSDATGVASVITYPDGTPITLPSNFCRLCKMIRETEAGKMNCRQSDNIIGKQNIHGPVIQPCLSGGLWDAGAGIALGGTHVANWLVGQVRQEEVDEEKMLDYAREIGLDPDQFKEALYEVPVMTKERFEKVTQALSILANQLSLTAYQNMQQARFIAEQQKAEEALKINEARFRGIAQNIPGVVFQFYSAQNGEMGLKYASDLTKKYLGIDNKQIDLVFDLFAAGIVEEERMGFYESVNEAVEGKKPWDWEGHYIKPDDHKKMYFHGVAQPRFLGDELIFDGIFLDITERKESAEKISQLVKLQQSILDTVTVGIQYIVKRNTIWTNAVFEKMSAEGFDEVTLADGSVCGNMKDLNGIIEVASTLYFKRSEIYTTELKFKRKNNTLLWCYLAGRAINSQNLSEGSIWMIQDITERKDAEIALQKSELVLKATMESMYEGLLVVTHDRKISHFNTRFQEMFSVPQDMCGLIDDRLLLLHCTRQLMNPEYAARQVNDIYQTDDKTEDIMHFADGRIVERFSYPLKEESPIKGRVWLFRDITERKRAEEALYNNEVWLRESQRIAHIGTWKFKLNDQRLIWNEAAFEIAGYKYLEIEPNWETLMQQVHPDDRWLLPIQLKKAIGEKTAADFECRIIRPDGSIRTILVASAIEFDEKGKVTGLFGIIQDITERKMADTELRETRERLQSFMDSATDAFTIWDKDLKLLDINNTALSFFPHVVKKENLLGVFMGDFWPGFDKNPIYQKFEHVLSTGNSYVGTDVIEMEAGKKRWLTSRAFKVKDGLGIASSDITEQKKAEAVLQEKDARLRSIYGATPVGMGLTTDRKINECNEAFNKMVGYPLDEILGKDVRFLYSTEEDYLFVGREQIRQMQNKQEEPIETVWKHKNGTLINILLRFAPVDASDYHKGISFTAIDITDRKKTEEEIRRLNTELEKRVFERTLQLEEANRDLEAFAYSVSHDLRAPIRHIDGFLKLMYGQIQQKAPAITDYYSKIDAASHRMSAMIDSLLSFSRMGRKELVLSRLDTQALILEIIDVLKPDIKERRIQWDIGQLPPIYCDISLMRLAFENLISNAIKYTSKRKDAFISIGSNILNDKQIEIYFKDNGIGFNMDYVEKLFGVFQRLHSSSEFEGIGIGLANVKQIIKKHGGSIRAEGKINEGATFYINLPRLE